MTFAQAIRCVRTARKLTQAALADRAGLSRTQLTRLEGGLKPGPRALQGILGAFGFTIGDELLAAAGDADAIEKLAGYAQSQADFKKRAAARNREVSRLPALPPSRPTTAARLAALRPARPSAAARGYGKWHRQLRTFILKRDPWCVGVPEGIHGNERVRTTVMDHFVSLRMGGATTPENTRGVCRACNGRKSLLVEGAGYQGRAFQRRIEKMRWWAAR